MSTNLSGRNGRALLRTTGLALTALLLLAFGAREGFGQTSCSQFGGTGDSAKRPSVRSANVASPFDRLIAPALAKTKGKAKLGKTVGAAAFAPAVVGNTGVGGTALNFPGFVSAPTLQLQAANGCNLLQVSVSGDFDNDGNLDVVTIQQDGTVKMVLNPGPGGSLATAKMLPPDSSYAVNNSSILYLTTADLNSDGNLDLIGQDVVHSQFVVWLGNGDGTFQNSVAYSVAPKSGASWFNGGGFFVVADFNGDGSPDVATVSLDLFSGTVTELTYANDGQGNFTAGTESGGSIGSFYDAGFGQGDVVSAGGAPTGIAFMVRSSNGFSVLVIHSNGDGTFAPAVAPTKAFFPDYYFTATSSFYATNLTANFSKAPVVAGKSGKGPQARGTVGSGIPTTDLVFATGSGAIFDVPYTEQGVSYDPTTINVLAGTDTQIYSSYPNPIRPQAKTHANNGTAAASIDPIPFENFLNVADMNGDGVLDLVLYTQGTIYVYPNNGSGSFTAPPAQVAAGKTTYTEPQPGNFAGFTYTTNPSIVDVDYQFDTLSIYAGNGTGQFYAAPVVGGTSTNGGGSYTALGGNITVVATGDVNGDGVQDVIAYDWTNAATPTNQGYPDVVVGINKGGKPQANETTNFTFSTVLSAADFLSNNGSFIEPVTFASPSGGLSVLLSAKGGLAVMTSTNGVFGPPVWLINESYLSCPFTFADAGDVNGDGITDIVVTYPGSASCTGGAPGYPSGYFTFIGASDGTYKDWYFSAYGSSLYQPRLIDLDGNGSPDLVLSDQDFTNDIFGVYSVPNMSDGTGMFDMTKVAAQATNYIVSDIVSGDYNADGKQDLTLTTQGQFNTADPSALIQPGTQGVLLLPGNGDFTFGLPALVNSGYFADWGSYADFNGDGMPDLALAEYGVSADGGDEGVLLPTPIVRILPNLGGGNFGPAVTLNDGLFDFGYFDSPNNQVNTLTHQIYTFTGNFGNSGGNDLLVSGSFATAEFVNLGQSTLTVTASSATAGLGQPLALTATVASGSQPVPASGSVTFTSGGIILGEAALNATGAATLSTTQLPVGGDVITATYSGDANYNAATGSATVTITPLAADTLTLTASPTSAPQGQPVVLTATLAGTGATPATGLVMFSSNGTFLGAAQLNAGAAALTVSQLAVGSDTITASYAGDANDAASSGTDTVSISAVTADTLTLTATPTSASQGQPVTLTATMQGLTATPPTGSVTFYTNGVLLGAAQLTGGAASFTSSELAVGSDAITASYSGDANYHASSGKATVTVVAVQPAFTVSAGSGSLSLVQGATGAVTLSISANTTFSGVVTFTCTGAPAESTCGVNPGSLTLAPGQTGTATVVVATTPPNSSYQARREQRPPWTRGTSGIALAGVGILLWPVRRKLGRLSVMLVVLVSLGLGLGLTGCSGGSSNGSNPAAGGSAVTDPPAPPKYAGTPVGPATLTVSVTSGTVTQTQTIALTVTAP